MKVAGWAPSVCPFLPPKEGEKKKHERENKEQTTTNNRRGGRVSQEREKSKKGSRTGGEGTLSFDGILFNLFQLLYCCMTLADVLNLCKCEKKTHGSYLELLGISLLLAT